VASRPKQGFTIPVEQLLARQWKGSLASLKDDTLLEKAGWIRKGALRSEVQRAEQKQEVPQGLWYLLVLEHWLRAEQSKQTTALEPQRSVPC